MSPVRLAVCIALLALAALAGGCAGWSQTPFNPQQACTAGVVTADGRCLAGNL